ncbi:MAG: hypothetical protein IJT40_02500 [Firmicutes bacterium]|nr:hypothetical protein [Bacillota bacterium]
MIIRENIGLIFDEGSFCEFGERSVCSVITGYGTVEGQQVYCFLQDASINGGAFSVRAVEKIRSIYRLALKAHAPVIGLLDSTGFLVDEGAEALYAFSDLYRVVTEAKDEILQIMIAGDSCRGQVEALCTLADFFFRDMPLEKAVSQARDIILRMPPARGLLPDQFETDDDLNRRIENAAYLKFNGLELLRAVSDGGAFLEIEEGKAPCLTAGFIRINGLMVAAMAVNGEPGENSLGSAALIKARDLVLLADKFGLGFVEFLQTDGFRTDEDKETLLRNAAELAKTLNETDIPKVCIITGEVMGGAYSVLSGPAFDLTFMWEGSKVNIINPRQAAELVSGPQPVENIADEALKYEESHSTAEVLASKGLCHRIIDPADTRKFLAGALESYANVY